MRLRSKGGTLLGILIKILINMLKVYTNSHPASHKDTNHSNNIQMHIK